MTTRHILIKGIVQGVGFRPFIKNLADSLFLKGSVINSSIGVEIKINITDSALQDLITKISKLAPKSSYIRSIESSIIDDETFDGFSIMQSEIKEGLTLISPDLAICPECVKDILDKTNRRYFYPFTNCTNCGPRYSIISAIPYDRKNTTMDSFKICSSCKIEYEDSFDRRFHAEPNACADCGPSLKLTTKNFTITDNSEAIKKTANLIDNGEIIALKGLGGYHLICSAYGYKAISKLREKKRRRYKPFAVMVKDIETIKKYAELSDSDIELLSSTASPILIVDFKPDAKISKLVSPTVKRIGVMLAYTPLHRLLFELAETDMMIATSGNLFDEPIIADNDEAKGKLSVFTDIFLEHDRQIYTRLDDSVATKYGRDDYLYIRRSRGYSPEPKYLGDCAENNTEIFAAGANLKSSLALYKDGYAFTSQYIGDLDNVDSCEYYKEVYKNLTTTFFITPKVALADLHDDFFSTKFAKSLGVDVEQVQHHVAHFLAVLSEHDKDINSVGLILDGFGLGYDSAAWGGEIFVKQENIIHREAHMKYYTQAGMDLSAKKPSVMLISYLHTMGLLDQYETLLCDRLSLDADRDIKIIKSMVDKKLNSIPTSSAGRLFEAVGSLILSDKNGNEYEGDLAIRLENIVDKDVEECYSFSVESNEFDFKTAFEELLLDIKNGVAESVMAAKFHNGFAKYISEMAIAIAERNKIIYIALSGGVFQNIYLLDKIKTAIETANMTCLINNCLPVNDGCIAMGQLYGKAKAIRFKK